MSVAEHELSILDFKTTSSICMQYLSDFSPESRTPYVDVEWIHYCPDVFSILQKYGQIDQDDYMASICTHEIFRRFGLYEKSSSRIFLSHDSRFVIRAIHKSELKVFLEKLPNYYHHVRKYKNTLLTKIYGLHVVKPSARQKTGRPFSKVYFVVMGNVLNSDLRIHKRYDLKVSQGRGSKESQESSTKEDDLYNVFYLDPAMRNIFIAQLKLDCNFLEDIGVTDYSFLLGLHLPTTPLVDQAKSPARTDDIKGVSGQDGSSSGEPNKGSPTIDNLQLCSRVDQTKPPAKLGVQMLATAVGNKRDGNLTNFRAPGKGKGRTHNIVLFFEITDILNCYGMVKRMESVLKPASKKNPKSYAARFQDYISQIFPENKSGV